MPSIQLTGYKLPLKAELILKNILQTAGLSSARVSDLGRTFDQQAKVIVDYYKLHGSHAARMLYGKGPGGRALDVYEAEVNEKPLQDVLHDMAEVMREQIRIERLHGGQHHLMHTSETHCVFDVAPSSISDRAAFVKAASRHPQVSRFLHPGSAPPDKVFHLEIRK